MKKRIGIDMRMAGEGFGIGKYITELASALIKRKSEFEYVLFFDKNFSAEAYNKFSKIHPHCRLIAARYYSLEEQIKLPAILSRERLDLVHFPNFNVPLLYPGKTVITIHDLIHHRFSGKRKKNFLYRWGYRTVINLAARKALQIITVSSASKNDIIRLLGISPEKVSFIYNGLAENFKPDLDLNKIETVKRKYKISKPYLLWVGVWRKYKNLPLLSQAFELVQNRLQGQLQLVLVGEEDGNYPEIKPLILKNRYSKDIIAPGRILEPDLIALYSGALAYISPSLLEGINLPALEAQACSAPLIASDTSVAREIFGDSAMYFDPREPQQLIERILEIFRNSALRQAFRKKANENSLKYRWEKTATETEGIYRKILLPEI